MIYQQLYNRSNAKKPVTFALIGAGHYGTKLVTQSMNQPLSRASAVSDVNLELARNAYKYSGIPDEDIVFCDSHKSAIAAMDAGKRIITDDAMILMELPIDVIAEGTGVPESGAKHAYGAIQNGKHVAMINKETDSAVGPILKRLADKAGLVYTAVDGDQHGLLMGLTSWARGQGYEILCGGKFRDGEYFYDKDRKALAHVWDLSNIQYNISVHDDDLWAMDVIPDGVNVEPYLQKRKEIVPNSRLAGFDFCEMTIACNTLGFAPSAPALNGPFLRVSEIPSVLCLKEDGGILEKPGVVDGVTFLSDKGGVIGGGGVFIVVSCEKNYAGKALAQMNLHNRNETAAVIYRPYHFTGIETLSSILCAALLNIPTGSDEYLPRYDIVRTAAVDLQAGFTMFDDHGMKFIETLILPASKKSGNAPVPAHLTDRNKLLVDVPRGTVITYNMIEQPADSLLWSLRKQQDELFL